MKAVAAYMAYRNRENGNDRRNEYHEPGRREYENRSEYGGQRQPNQYTQRNEMGGYWPENNDQRGGRDGRGREMNDYGGAESRYRGRDGRWRAGRRRSEYDGGAYDNYPMDRRMGDDEDDDEEEERKKYSVTVQPKNVIEWPYGPGQEMPPESRVIGFGNQPREYDPRSHYGGGRQEANVGGTMWMQPTEEHHADDRLDKHSMEKWVRHMRDDKDMPIKPWTIEEVKPLAMRFGYPTSGEKFDEFYTAIHMMKSDFCAVAEDFDVNTPAFFAALADAWLKDPDAAVEGREKLEAYYKYIVKGKK